MTMTTPIHYFMQGYNAAVDDLPAEACPLLFEAWPREAWLAGHAFYTTTWPKVLAAELGEPAELKRVDKSPYEQGRVAALRGYSLAACPYGDLSPTERDLWATGWRHVKLSANIKRTFDTNADASADVAPSVWLRVLIGAAMLCGIMAFFAAYTK